MKKITKKDLPNKNFEIENIIYSLVKAIFNEKNGNYKDCGFTNENDFISILNALSTSKIVELKNNCENNNLGSYTFNLNLNLNIQKKSNIIKWLKNNVITILATLIELSSIVWGKK